MGWKKRFGKQKQEKLNLQGLTELYYLVKERMAMPSTMSISAKDFKRMTGLSLPDEANLVWFTPEGENEPSKLYPDGRYVIPGKTFLKMLEGSGIGRSVACIVTPPGEDPITLQ